MQDEVNEKTMALCIKGGKISAQLLKAALTKLLSEIEKKKQQSKKMGGQNRCKRGKQSIEVFNDERVKIRFTFEDVLKNYEAE